MVESEVYFVKKNEEADFVSLHNDDNITYSFLELPNGKLTVTKQEFLEEEGVFKISKLCYKGKNWYKLIHDENDFDDILDEE